MGSSTKYHPISCFQSLIHTFKRNPVIKKLVTLLIFGLPYSNGATAQELGSGEMDVPEGTVLIAGPTAELTSSSPGSSFFSSFYSPTSVNQPGVSAQAHGDTLLNMHSFGRPVIVLPMQPYIDAVSGFQYPGSYMPRGTPLHRFNGYIICTPPNLNRDTGAKAVAGTGAQRVIKITSTRSPSMPGHSGPCPIYTINGELPSQKSHSTILPPDRIP
jgi:hypothetical protein